MSFYPYRRRHHRKWGTYLPLSKAGGTGVQVAKVGGTIGTDLRILRNIQECERHEMSQKMNSEGTVCFVLLLGLNCKIDSSPKHRVTSMCQSIETKSDVAGLVHSLNLFLNQTLATYR